MKTLVLQQGLSFRQAELGARLQGNSFQKAFRISAISAAVIFLAGVIMFNLQNPVILNASASSAPIAVTSDSSRSVVSSMSGINIANNGSIFVQGAKVTGISGNSIKINTSWGSTNFAWVVQISGTTKFLNHQGEKQTISDIKVGDIVMVTGKLMGDSNQFAINAEFVRE